MNKNSYVSTGEAAKILGVSRSTVSRRFDEGILRGKAHPITGERLIAIETVESFLNKYSHPTDADSVATRQLVLRSRESDLIAMIESIAVGDRRIRVEVAERGSEALIICVRKSPTLLILDDTPTDIACPDIISALRRLDDRNRLAVLCCLRRNSPQEVVSWGADAAFPMTTTKAETFSAQLYRLLHLPPREAASPVAAMEHKRRWPRHALHLPGTIGIYRARVPEEQTRGSVMVDNISLGGAGLSKMRVATDSLPAESFRMLLEIDDPLLPAWHAHCQVVRLKVNGEITAGVQFVELSPESRDKLMAFERARDPRLSSAVPA
jgi:hypothetical protein